MTSTSPIHLRSIGLDRGVRVGRLRGSIHGFILSNLTSAHQEITKIVVTAYSPAVLRVSLGGRGGAGLENPPPAGTVRPADGDREGLDENAVDFACDCGTRVAVPVVPRRLRVIDIPSSLSPPLSTELNERLRSCSAGGTFRTLVSGELSVPLFDFSPFPRAFRPNMPMTLFRFAFLPSTSSAEICASSSSFTVDITRICLRVRRLFLRLPTAGNDLVGGVSASVGGVAAALAGGEASVLESPFSAARSARISSGMSGLAQLTLSSANARLYRDGRRSRDTSSSHTGRAASCNLASFICKRMLPHVQKQSTSVTTYCLNPRSAYTGRPRAQLQYNFATAVLNDLKVAIPFVHSCKRAARKLTRRPPRYLNSPEALCE